MSEGWEQTITPSAELSPLHQRAALYARAMIASSFFVTCGASLLAFGGVLNVWWLKLGQAVLLTGLIMVVFGWIVFTVSYLIFREIKRAIQLTSP